MTGITMKKIISTEKAPAAIGPYSQAVEAAGLLFISGQLPIDPATGSMAPAEIKAQTEAVIKNLENILASQGPDPENNLTTTIFMVELPPIAPSNALHP